MWGNWTRKLSIVVVFVWAGTVFWRVVIMREAVGLSDIASSAALILATVGGKSVLSAYVASKPVGNGDGTK